MSKKQYQEYSQLAVAVDLVSYEYKTSNPIIIAEKIEEDLGLEYSIHQVSDYLNINYDDFEKENRKIYYNCKY